MPTLTLIAGPQLGRENRRLLNGSNLWTPDFCLILPRSRRDFAVETTLSGRASLALIDSARARGYEIHLTFVALDSPERCIARIRTRALRGGHSVPDADVRRRYERSLANQPAALPMVDIAKI